MASPLSFFEAIRKIERALLERQAADGSWADFPDVEVGPSQAWTTAYVGSAIAAGAPSPAAVAAVRRAVNRVLALKRVDGWGYNGFAATDADSTAWALRLLLRVGATTPAVIERILAPFLSIDGSVHTFPERTQFGDWSKASDEVAPIAALALAEADPRSLHAAAIAARQRRVAEVDGDGFDSFWWESDDYALGWNGAMFQRLGLRLPDAMTALFARRIQSSGKEHFADALVAIGAPAVALRSTPEFGRSIVARVADEAWAPDAWLLVPGQETADPPSYHCDQGNMTGATLLLALKRLRKLL